MEWVSSHGMNSGLVVARIISRRRGYVGHDESGHLSDAIRTHPYRTVLLDEIEKAHPTVPDFFRRYSMTAFSPIAMGANAVFGSR